jgi:glycerophosphoryl diester phosphodiesterase
LLCSTFTSVKKKINREGFMFFDHLPQQGLIFAHRGARSIAPENTILAMSKAKESGVHCWETDIQMSKDGELVIFHDATLERTTDIVTNEAFRNCTDYRISQFTKEELGKLDAGSWFLSDDPFATVASSAVKAEEHTIIKKLQIPSVREILDFTKCHSFPVNLEIKELETAPEDFSIVDKVVEMLVETGTMDLVLLSSGRHEYLHYALELNRDVSVAVLARDQHPTDLLQYLRSFPTVAYHPDYRICDRELIVQVQDAGFRVNCWTVNDMDRAQELLRWGAGVITDWPQNLLTR